MARLTLEQVREVAQLAALELDEHEAQTLCDDLGAILDHFAALAAVDVSGAEPTVHPVPLPAGARPDRAVLSGLGEATRAGLGRMERLDGAVGAFLKVDADGALRSAAELDQARALGERLGPLA